ncbi:response regulator [Sphingomonas canadensis]|uniref:Response regulator n=1 Tax=Sphingomonas canadensis TaxID=1219257 RepID=A0ABW3H742_9SPHN|nr:response regulator transcription factor [Sphingomonas canadensis]MCW3835905.1 response regulator transcription factor [Sphingomonas canadensis]
MSSLPAVLVIDDEPHIRRLLSGTLARAGYRVAEAANGRQAIEALPQAQPDVVLLDLGLPDRDGLELIPAIRKQSRAAILVVSAREATEQKVTALDLGAVDYVTKPFDTEELLARVRAALRGRLTAEGGRTGVTAGGVAFDLVNHRVTRDGEEIHLTPKEFAVVAELARFPGRVITHRQLLDAVWPLEHERHIEYLRVVIRNLRQKLEADPARPAIVVNELGVGYRLMGAEG